MNVRTTNFISEITLRTGVESGAVAWAAHALQSPIGAVGGAIFGAVRSVSQLLLGLCGVTVLNSEDRQASAAAKTLAAALEIFGSFAAAWAVLAVAGFSLTVSHMVGLTVMSIFTTIALHFILKCISPDHRPLEEGAMHRGLI